MRLNRSPTPEAEYVISTQLQGIGSEINSMHVEPTVNSRLFTMDVDTNASATDVISQAHAYIESSAINMSNSFDRMMVDDKYQYNENENESGHDTSKSVNTSNSKSYNFETSIYSVVGVASLPAVHTDVSSSVVTPTQRVTGLRYRRDVTR